MCVVFFLVIFVLSVTCGSYCFSNRSSSHCENFRFLHLPILSLRLRMKCVDVIRSNYLYDYTLLKKKMMMMMSYCCCDTNFHCFGMQKNLIHVPYWCLP